MVYQKFKPCTALQPFVECYYVWESAELINDLVVESPPSGFCSIVFNSGDQYFLQNKKYERLAVPKQFIAGQSIYSYKLFLKGKISIAGIVFKPAALASLFSLPTYEYTEERIPLQHVFTAKTIEPIIEKLQSEANQNEKIKLLEAFVLFHYKNNNAKADYIDNAANAIVESNGMVHINDLMKEVFMSRRNFERRFFKKVGLSPKYYARLRRISFLMSLIAGKKRVDWIHVFSQCEFYDQSHFIKDFLEFNGRTPQQYLEANTELANMVDKPITKALH